MSENRPTDNNEEAAWIAAAASSWLKDFDPHILEDFKQVCRSAIEGDEADRLREERDEARAELARLRKLIHDYIEWPDGSGYRGHRERYDALCREAKKEGGR